MFVVLLNAFQRFVGIDSVHVVVVKVKFEQDDKIVEGKAILDPQNRNLKLYDSDMNRINTNKPLEGIEQDNKHEKSNVKEQSIKR